MHEVVTAAWALIQSPLVILVIVAIFGCLMLERRA